MPFAGGDNFDDEVRGSEIVKRPVPISPDSNFYRRDPYMVLIDFDSGASLARLYLNVVCDGAIWSLFWFSSGRGTSGEKEEEQGRNWLEGAHKNGGTS